MEDDNVKYVISTLISSPYKHIIEKDPYSQDGTGVINTEFGFSLANDGVRQAAYVHVSFRNSVIEENLDSTPTSTLGHELMHAFDIDQGNYKGMISNKFRGVNPMEIRAVYFENLIRRKKNLPIRKTYGGLRISPKEYERVKIQ